MLNFHWWIKQFDKRSIPQPKGTRRLVPSPPNPSSSFQAWGSSQGPLPALGWDSGRKVYQMLQLRRGRDGHPVNDNLAFAVWRDCHFTIQICEGSVFFWNSKRTRVCLSDQRKISVNSLSSLSHSHTSVRSRAADDASVGSRVPWPQRVQKDPARRLGREWGNSFINRTSTDWVPIAARSLETWGLTARVLKTHGLVGLMEGKWNEVSEETLGKVTD